MPTSTAEQLEFLKIRFMLHVYPISSIFEASSLEPPRIQWSNDYSTDERIPFKRFSNQTYPFHMNLMNEQFELMTGRMRRGRGYLRFFVVGSGMNRQPRPRPHHASSRSYGHFQTVSYNIHGSMHMECGDGEFKAPAPHCAWNIRYQKGGERNRQSLYIKLRPHKMSANLA